MPPPGFFRAVRLAPALGGRGKTALGGGCLQSCDIHRKKEEMAKETSAVADAVFKMLES